VIPMYGPDFARFYHLKCEGFANEVAPRILEFYASTSMGQTNSSILDLCCGTGELALYFLQRGYNVTGIDLSAAMLEYARTKAKPYIETGRARFIRDEATKFTLNERFGLVAATYDALNHLENEDALHSCFQQVYAVSEGYFIFDLNTQAGLQRWNSIQLDESEEAIAIVDKTFNEELGKARAKFSCFLRTPEGLYERISETVFNTLFLMDNVRNALLEVGWKEVYFARIGNLNQAVADPEQEGRVFIVAKK